MHHTSKMSFTATCVFVIALTGCGLPLNPAASPSASPTAAPPQPSAGPADTAAPTVSNVRVLIHVTTTSDWTTLHLVSGATWVNPTNVSSSPEATAATVQGDLVNLTQPLARAQAGQQVEISFDVFFAELRPADQVTFRNPARLHRFHAS